MVRPQGLPSQVSLATTHGPHIKFELPPKRTFRPPPTLLLTTRTLTRYLSRSRHRESPYNRQNGQDFRSQRLPQCHQQRREGWQAPGPDPPVLQGHRQVLDRHAAPRLHWRVRGGRRPPQRQDCHPAQRPHQQDRCHLAPLQRPAPRYGEVGCQAAALASVRLHRSDHLGRYHGPRGGEEEARCWQDPGLLLLGCAIDVEGCNIPGA